jgi:hypothetical protein
MAEVQASEVDANPAPVILGLSRIKFGNHGNKTILVWQLSHSCATVGSIVDTLFNHFNNGRWYNHRNQGM